MIGLGIIGAIFQFLVHSVTAAYGIYIAAGILGVPALTGLPIALPGYWLWMGIAFVMGNIMGRVILAVVFYGLITPMGLVRRLVNDKLQIRARGRSSYWKDIPNENEADRYERQF